MNRHYLHIPKSIGERAADHLAAVVGSWAFIGIQTFVVCIWIAANAYFLTHPVDPFPFILLNLGFSTQAAYAAPILQMASNRQATKDRARDNLEAQEVHELTAKLDEILLLLKLFQQTQTNASRDI